jgi:hypothetical protein
LNCGIFFVNTSPNKNGTLLRTVFVWRRHPSRGTLQLAIGELKVQIPRTVFVSEASLVARDGKTCQGELIVQNPAATA